MNNAANTAANDNRKFVIAPDFVATGDKYNETKDLDLAVIAKLVRADIADAIKRGILPAGIKCGVRISRFSMGQSLDVKVRAVPAGFVVIVSDEQADDNRASGVKRPWFSREAAWVLSRLEGIVEAYNRSQTNHQTDYHNNKFFSHVEFDV